MMILLKNFTNFYAAIWGSQFFSDMTSSFFEKPANQKNLAKVPKSICNVTMSFKINQFEKIKFILLNLDYKIFFR